jgi:hypothetical protein
MTQRATEQKLAYLLFDSPYIPIILLTRAKTENYLIKNHEQKPEKMPDNVVQRAFSQAG